MKKVLKVTYTATEPRFLFSDNVRVMNFEMELDSNSKPGELSREDYKEIQHEAEWDSLYQVDPYSSINVINVIELFNKT